MVCILLREVGSQFGDASRYITVTSGQVASVTQSAFYQVWLIYHLQYYLPTGQYEYTSALAASLFPNQIQSAGFLALKPSTAWD